MYDDIRMTVNRCMHTHEDPMDIDAGLDDEQAAASKAARTLNCVCVLHI